MGRILATMARTDSRGMVVVQGVTYRIERTAPKRYSVVRLLDDREVGTFTTRPALRIHPIVVDVNVLRDVVRAALKSARTSAVWHAVPALESELESAAAAPSNAPVPGRLPSTAPAPGTSRAPAAARSPSSAPAAARSPSSAPPAAPVMA